MISRTIFLLAISLCFFACGGDDDKPVFDDYREAWTGTYDCTKSNRGFDDDLFTTDIVLVVEIDSTSDSVLLINDFRVPVDVDGTFGLEEFEGSYYDLTFLDNEIRFSVNEIFPFGDAIACFIKGEKR